jgi:hypothetical protein
MRGQVTMGQWYELDHTCEAILLFFGRAASKSLSRANLVCQTTQACPVQGLEVQSNQEKCHTNQHFTI